MSNTAITVPPPSSAVTAPPASPEFAQANQLLRHLFAPGDTVLIRPIESWIENEKKQTRTLWRNTRWQVAGTICEASLEHLNRLSAAEHANIFFGVAPRVDGEGFDYAWQIRTVRCLWSDIDDVSPQEAIAKCAVKGLPRPSIVVASGTVGGHLYWLLSQPYLIDDVGPPPRVRIEWLEIGGAKKPIHYFEDPAGQRVYLDDPATGRRLEHPELSGKAQHLRKILQGIAATIGGDHTIDATRLLRLPGTMNRKDERNGREARPCTIVECSGERYDIGLFERFADVKVPDEKPPRSTAKSSKTNRSGSAKSNSTGYIPTDEEIIQRIADSKQGEKFQLLMSGQHDFRHPNGTPDDSRADESLCSILAYWTRDPVTIDRIFRMSRLCDEKWTSRPDYRDATISGALDLVTDRYEWRKAGPRMIPLIKITETCSLQIVDERKTDSRKICIQAKLQKTDGPAILISFSSSPSNRREVVRQITGHITPPTIQGADSPPLPNVDGILGQILADSHDRLSAAAAAKDAEDVGESIREILYRVVPMGFDLAYRTADGKAWSEAWGRPVSRQEFISHIPEGIVQACKAGRDVKRSEEGDIDELALVRSIETHLKVLWSTLIEQLPFEAAGAALDADSSDAEQFRAAIVRIWTSLTTHQAQTDGTKDSLALPARASLASRVLKEFQWMKVNKGATRKKWLEVQSAFAAWWRPYVRPNAELRVLLAMRYTLLDQVKIPVAGVVDQTQLAQLGKRYGVFSCDPPATDQLTGGQRLVVLSDDITDEILTQSSEILELQESTNDDDESSNDSCGSDAGFSATAEIFERQPT